MEYVESFARDEGCKYVVLACGRERAGAVCFYERLGFERPGYSMREASR
jgi:GNAT superfamily N-acetyltransferase